MVKILLISFFVMAVILVPVLVWMILEQKKLKQEYTQLKNSLERSNNDIAGLCSAAVSVDHRISENNEQINEVLEAEVEIEQNEQPLNQVYDSAIERIRNGENVDGLVQHCGLSRDEAELLIRLHS